MVTDHQPLKWLMESDKLTEKLARWALMLMEYDFKVVHRARFVNMDADGLSVIQFPTRPMIQVLGGTVKVRPICCRVGMVRSS